MQYEDAIKAVGGCGPYQVFILNLLYIATLLDGLQIGSMVFIVPEIKHRCAIPDLANDTYEVQNELHAKLIEEYIPREIKDGESLYSKCHLYTNYSVLGNQTLDSCNSWVYDKSIFQSSIPSDFDLVCDKKWLSSQVYTVFFAGYLVAMLCCGWLSDRLGRKTVIVTALLLQGTAGIMSSLIMNVKVILALRFLTAIGGAGSYIPSVVFGAEISSMKKRTNASISIQIYFTFGYIILTLMAFYIRTWSLIVLLVSLPSIPLALLNFWLLPESPRWLLVTKKENEAKKVLNKIAKVNKRDFNCSTEEIGISVVEDKTVRLWKIITIPELRKRTLILLLNWCIVSFVYFGLTLNSGHLSGNIYLNFFFGGLVEIPAYLLSMVLLKWIGRRDLYIASMILAGLCAIVTIFPFIYGSNDLKWTTTTLAIISKLFISAAFGILYLHTCELYPTCVRNGALGAIATCSRFGGVIAPYVMLLQSLADGRLGESLPLLTMGLVCIFATAFYFFLPETSNRPLEDTFDDLFKPNLNEPISEKGEYELEARTALNTAA